MKIIPDPTLSGSTTLATTVLQDYTLFILFQFVENPWTQHKVLGLNPAKRAFSRRTLVRRIGDLLGTVEEKVIR
jgi:hypothetical protein